MEELAVAVPAAEGRGVLPGQPMVRWLLSVRWKAALASESLYSVSGLLEKSTRRGPETPPGPVVVWTRTTGVSIMFITMSCSMPSMEKDDCQEPVVPLRVRASRQMDPPAVTWPVYIRHLQRW